MSGTIMDLQKTMYPLMALLTNHNKVFVVILPRKMSGYISKMMNLKIMCNSTYRTFVSF